MQAIRQEMDLDETFDSVAMEMFGADEGTEEATATDTQEASEPLTYDGTEFVPTSQEDTGAPAEAAPADEDDLRTILEQQKAAHPEQAAIIDAIHREFQRGLTPKLQQAAELRKAYEGVDPQLAAWARQMNELASQNPAEAAAALMAEAERLRAHQQAAPQVEEPDFATDYDREVWHEVQELKALKQQLVAERNEQTFNAELDKQAKDLGIEIPYEERHRVLVEMHKDRAPANAARRYWRDLYFDKALQKARDEAAGVVGKKQAMGAPPSTLANRAGTGAQPEPASFEEAMLAEFRTAGAI